MLPEKPGTYVLILRLPRRATISIGRLGVFAFPAGWYAYAGSALGPGGLAARVSRHRRQAKACHWHIDYLRTRAEPITVWYTPGRARRECLWAELLSGLSGASVPVPRFGASDCRCPAHLIQLSTDPDFSAFSRLAGSPVSETVL